MHTFILCLLSVFTTYNEFTFHTECVVDVNAPYQVADILIDSIIHDFQNDPENLFSWAFQGVGKQNDTEKEIFLIEYKNTAYDPVLQSGRADLDIIVPGLTVIHDVSLIANVIDYSALPIYNPLITTDTITATYIPSYTRHIFIDATYSGNLLKKAYGSLYIIPVNKQRTIYYMDMNVRFGWFFRIFISKRTYKNTMEWRVEQYMTNLKNTAEAIYIL